MKKTNRILAMLLVLVMVVSCFAGCKKKPQPGPDENPGGTAGTKAEYTYRTYTTQLGVNWNPHAWETNYDGTILDYLTTPLVTAAVKDSENGIYQWVYKAATSVTDVTKDHKDDLTKYKVTLPKGQSAEQTEAGYVFEIKLNPDMKWQDGTAINADSYIDSMKALLDPTMMNYRANLYYNGESAVAGGYNYYYALSKGIYSAVEYAKAAGMKGDSVYVNLWKDFGAQTYTDASGNACPEYAAINDATAYSDGQGNSVSGKDVYAQNKSDFASGKYALYTYKVNENYNENYAETYDATVGCYKVDDYTIRYVTQAKIDLNYFLNACSSNWLVHKDLYEKGKDTSGKLVTTNYGTGMDTTMSYGPYKMTSLQDGKQVVFEQNENYYEYEKKEDGTLYAESDYLVDDKNVQIYQTTKIVIDVMTDEAAKQAFLKGDLSEWTPTADEIMNYLTSEQMYQVDETYTYSLFFNTNLDALKEMDKSKGNQNSVVLSNDNFRKAMSFAIDREDWVTATAGYKPAFALMNESYYYDIFNDPYSIYRNSVAAKQALTDDVYELEYFNGRPLATLDEAYDSITGYEFDKAKDLMAMACLELVRDGLYKQGEEIKIRVAYSGGALDSSSQSQISKLNEYLNAAMEGSGFGKITLEGEGNIAARTEKVPAGEYAIGYGAWGGAAFYPFRNMKVYCDPTENKVNELGCWDPTTELLTIQVEEQEVTKTWQEWSRSLVGTGEYADAGNNVKLQITATMEGAFLNKFYRIPLAASRSSVLLSYQVANYTDNYNIMYGFGGLELMTYNYTDAQWADYVAKQGGTLSYE